MNPGYQRASVLIGVCFGLALLAVPAGRGQESEVTLKAVKYAEMGAIVKQLKGKVVVVDFWADF